MKGCARSCLTGLIGLFVVIAGLHLWFRRLGVAQEFPGPESVVPGLLATLSVSFLWSVRDVLRDRRLLRDALAGAPPVDGERSAFCGVIRSSAPLTAPISGKPAVAFRYRIDVDEDSDGPNQTSATFEGTALSPSTIATSTGNYRLLTVPNFDFPEIQFSHDTAARHVPAYIAATRFETKETPKDARQTAEKEWTDDDGAFRRDKQGPGKIPDLELCRFHEQAIAQGERVSILGLYSQERGGIIPDPNWAYQAQVIYGDGESAIRYLETRTRRYVKGGLILGVIAVGICFAVVSGAWKP